PSATDCHRLLSGSDVPLCHQVSAPEPAVPDEPHAATSSAAMTTAHSRMLRMTGPLLTTSAELDRARRPELVPESGPPRTACQSLSITFYTGSVEPVQPSSRVTIRDVAAAAGVSVATVSKVINDRYGVSADTMARV